MKAVLMSIRPTWAQAIDRGEKTVEVRKTFPDFHILSCPFKVYLYCTQGRDKPVFITHPEGGYGSRVARKTVFGEFVCDWAEVLNELFVDGFGPPYHLPYNGDACLTMHELEVYGKAKRLWGWHISDYKWYREPKSLADFGLKSPPQSWCYVEEDKP